MATFPCPHCKQEHPTGAHFCPVTGNTIPQQRVCAHCGQAAEAAWRVCPACGSTLGGNEEQTSKGTSSPIRIAGVILLVVLLIAAGYGVSRVWPRAASETTIIQAGERAQQPDEDVDEQAAGSSTSRAESAEPADRELATPLPTNTAQAELPVLAGTPCH
jgi:RNA polymerase subunit RPABC4/transcription elongation factor Spt4